MTTNSKGPQGGEVDFVAKVYQDWTTLQTAAGDMFAFNRSTGRAYRVPHPDVPFVRLSAAPPSTKPSADAVTDAMVERACRAAAFYADGAEFPAAYSDEEANGEREKMRHALAAVLHGDGPKAYCEACQWAGMRNCQHFDECSGATCIACHRPLNATAPSADNGREAKVRELIEAAKHKLATNKARTLTVGEAIAAEERLAAAVASLTPPAVTGNTEK